MNFKPLKIKKILFCTLILCGIFSSSAALTAPDVWEVLRNQFSLNHETYRPEVQEQIRWLIAHPGYLHTVCRQSEPYIYHIVVEIKKRGLPGELALLPMIESSYNPFAYSGVGAAGLWQLMPGTGSELGLKQDWWVDGRRGISSSTDAALNYLVYLSRVFKGNWTLAIASYDAGEGTISRAMKAGASSNFWELRIPRETEVYVPRLFALAEIMENPQRYKLSLPEIPYLPYFEEVNIGSQIDLNHAAKMAGISYKELIQLNPGYNRWTTAPYKPFKLLIPTEKVQQFNLNLASLPEEKRVNWTTHHVQRGDSLNSIATRYHTTVSLIKQLNQLTTNNVKVNQDILIPNAKNTRPVPIITKKEPPTAKTAPFTSNKSQMANNIPAHTINEAQSRRVIHIVQGTDSYAHLERIYGVTTQEIQTWNKFYRGQRLRIGQQLTIWKKIRQPKAYIVQRGDSLNAIARKNNTQISQILTLNPELKKTMTVHPGQKILVS